MLLMVMVVAFQMTEINGMLELIILEWQASLRLINALVQVQVKLLAPPLLTKGKKETPWLSLTVK
jgi:hypothetical protein